MDQLIAIAFIALLVFFVVKGVNLVAYRWRIVFTIYHLHV